MSKKVVGDKKKVGAVNKKLVGREKKTDSWWKKTGGL